MDAIDTTNTSVDNYSRPKGEDQQDTEQEALPYPPELLWNEWSSVLPALIGTHETDVEQEVTENRRSRDLDLDPEKLRANKELDADETIIPIRVIDTNISSELPPFIRYLTASPRVAIFKDTKEPASTFADAETAFSSFVKYQDWIIPLYQAIDGSRLNGIDAIEICACDITPEVPGGFEFYAIADDCLVLPTGTTDLQQSPVVGLKLEITMLKLASFKKSPRFNPTAVSTLYDKLIGAKSTAKLDLIKIYKFYFKVEGFVYTAYYSPEYTSGWLAEPKFLDLGVLESKPEEQLVINPLTGLPATDPATGLPLMQTVEVFVPAKETKYPIHPIRSKLKEQKQLRASKGRGILDLPSQNAQTSLVSSFVNGTERATNVSASPEGEVEPGSSLEMLDITFEHGRIWNRPLKYHQPPFPPFDILRGVNVLDVRQKADMGQQSVAADNRVDSRKTAEEIKQASSKDDQLNSVSVTIFASWWAGILNDCWRIVHSKAQAGLITFCPDKPDYLERVFILLPSGDADYLQKEERIENFGKFWPMLANFPVVAATILADILKEVFPEKGLYYAQILMQSVQAQQAGGNQQVMQGLVMMLESLLENPAVANLPEAQQIAPQIAQLKQILGNSQQPTQPQQQAPA